MIHTCPTYLRKDTRKGNRGIANLNFLVLSGLLVLLAVFLIESDGLVGNNYKLTKYESDLNEQENLVRKLEIRRAEQTSFVSLQQAANNLNLVAAGEVIYLEAAAAPVALSR